MMNIRAMFVLLSSLGVVMFFSPEPSMRRINNEIILVEAAQPRHQGKHPVESAKKATEDVVHTASDYAKHTGEGIRHLGSAAYDKLSTSVRDGEEAVKSRAHHAHDDTLESVAELRDRLERRTQEAYDHSSDYASELRDRAGRARDSLEHRTHEAYENAADAASGYGSQVRERAAGARDSAEGKAHEVYEESSDAAHSVAGAAGKARDKTGGYVSSGVHSAREKLGGKAHDVGDSFHSLGDWISDEEQESAALSKLARAKEAVKEKVHGAVEYQPHLGQGVGYYSPEDHQAHLKTKADEGTRKMDEEHESALSKLGRVKEALKEKVHGAVEYQPHLGQGVGYYSPEDHQETGAHLKTKADEGTRKMEGYLEGAKISAREAMEKASEGLELLRDQLQEPEHQEEHPTLETARSRIRCYYDTTKDAVIGALTKKEQQLGRSLGSAKAYVEGHYEKAKRASLDSIDHQKEKLGQYSDMVRIKLNSGREAVFNYAMGTIQNGKEAIQNGKEAIVDEKNKLQHKVQELEQGAAKLGSNAKEKVNDSLEKAGRWAHDKMVKLNEKEEIAKRWIHKSVVNVVRLLHLFVFTSVFGSALWVTFISGFILSQQVPRQQFAVIQSKIFPVYLKMLGSGVAFLLATHTLLHPVPIAGLPELLQYYNLASCLILTLLNTFVLEPRVTKTMFEKLRLEKEEGRGVDEGQVPVLDEQTRAEMMNVGKRLQELHTWSSLVNLAVLAGMTWHLWYLNCRLVI